MTKEVSDRAFAKVLGQEMRLAREARGWTRVQLVEQLPSGIGDKTLLTYEHGTRYMTVVRFAEICRAIGIASSEVLDRATAKAADLRNHSLQVNLRAVITDKQPEFAPVRLWAARRRQETSTPHLVVTPASMREMAAVLGFTHERLAGYLAEFATDEDSSG